MDTKKLSDELDAMYTAVFNMPQSIETDGLLGSMEEVKNTVTALTTRNAELEAALENLLYGFPGIEVAITKARATLAKGKTS
jgi:hypothetical protein